MTQLVKLFFRRLNREKDNHYFDSRRNLARRFALRRGPAIHSSARGPNLCGPYAPGPCDIPSCAAAVPRRAHLSAWPIGGRSRSSAHLSDYSSDRAGFVGGEVVGGAVV